MSQKTWANGPGDKTIVRRFTTERGEENVKKMEPCFRLDCHRRAKNEP